MQYLLETKNLTKQFGCGANSQKAVDNMALHVSEGSIYGLLGPNGAGKSTALKMISGMLQPTEGEIVFEGRSWQRSDLYRIGSLIENPPLYSNLTARENLLVRTTLLGIPESQINEVLKKVDLADTGKKRVGQFSMGMKQRLGIALTLLGDPRLIILDEPTNGLDPIGIEDLRGLMRSFSQEGITVVVSSHILTEVSQIADHIGIIACGHLAYESELKAETNLEALFMDVCRDVAKTHHMAHTQGGVR